MNSKNGESRIERVKIQYDFLLKYYKKCMLQGHNKIECRILHPELKKAVEDEQDNLQGHNVNNVNGKGIIKGQQKYQYFQDNQWHLTRSKFPDKGYQGEKPVTPERVNTINQFQALTDKTEENI